LDTINKILVGHVAKVHGLHGLFSIKLHTPLDLFPLFKHLKIIYIEETPTPLYINSIKLSSKVFITIKTKQIVNRDHAKSILRKNVYIKLGDHQLIDDAFIDKNEFLDYKMVDLKKGTIGKIVEINHNRPQPLFIVQNQTKTIQIPFVKELIIKINRNKQIIHVDLPEGLTEICSQ